LLLTAAACGAGFGLAVLDLAALPGPRSAARIAAGAIFLLASIGLVATLRPPDALSFGTLATAVVLTGLAVDALIGETIRAGIGLRS
jgi:hypothetical protein